MSDYRCIIVEDEPLAVKVLGDYVAQVPFLKLDQVFKNAIEAGRFLTTHDTDILFLDIHLPALKGLAFLKTLEQLPAVVVTTAYHQYASEAFDLNVADYLVKPFGFERFLAGVNKAVQRLEKKKYTAAVKDHFFVNEQHRKIKLLFSDILYIESQKEYIRIVLPHKVVVTKMSTGEVEKILPYELFRRVHRSFIVAINKIDAFTTDNIEIAGQNIPVGKGYKESLRDL